MRRISAWPRRGLAPVLVACGLLGALSGCAGPKRVPPVATGPRIPPETRPEPGVPALLGVGLVENADELVVSGLGPARLLDAADGRLLADLGGGEKVTLGRDGAVVRWRTPSGSGRAENIVLRPNDVSTRVHHGEHEYRGELQVFGSPRGGGLTLVNAVDLESYLKGVVPWEIGRHGPEKMAALQAQAIAARTYTVSHLGARRERGFDLFASVMDQVYKGADGEDPRCNEAVDSTAGLVLRHADEEIEAYYSACCGGVSSAIEEVWARGGRPYLAVANDVPDDGSAAYCAESAHFHWRETWTIGQLEDIVAETLPEYLDWLAESPQRQAWAGPVFTPRSGASNARRPGRVWNLEITDRTTSGRVAALEISTDAGVYTVRGDRTRWVLRPVSGHPFIMRSALFDLELERDGTRLTRVATRGRGYGHGIGLCQTGALARAARGQTFAEILAHYYPGARLMAAGAGGAP
ncbi:SpoIID/LytB domain-containing protein [bacterium]|nr:SpoIID/LytB domain-containing protein [bacterium]